MVASDYTGEMARAFGLGDDARFTGRAERGEQGQVDELVTSHGAFAVKTSFDLPELDAHVPGVRLVSLSRSLLRNDVVPDSRIGRPTVPADADPS